MGVLQVETQRLNEAEAAYSEARDTYRELIRDDPAAYWPEFMLNNLDNLMDEASLNDANVVDRIIRDFTSEVLGMVGRADFMALLDFRCRGMNSLFLRGPESTDRYQRSSWNTPEQLGEHVLKALRINGETRLAVRDAFMVYVNALLDVVDPDGKFNGAVLEPLIANLRDPLLGRPVPVPLWPTPG